MHDKESPFPIADAHGRLECKENSGEVSGIKIQRSLLETSSVLYILQLVVTEVRVETSTILESAKVASSRDWLSQMLPVTARLSRK